MKVLKLYILFAAFTCFLLGASSIASAQCGDPVGTTGEIIYNETHARFVGCKDDNTWQSLHKDTGVYVPFAMKFDTSSYLQRGGALTGLSDCRSATASFWIKRNDGFGVTTMIWDGGATNSYLSFLATNRLYWEGVTLQGSTAITDSEWHHFLISFDATTGDRHIYLNDVAETISGTMTNADKDFEQGDHFIGVANNMTAQIDSDIADLYIDFCNYIDLSVEANRRKFIDSNGNPVDLGSNGSLPTGSAPDIFLSGDPDSWHTNKGTGGGFTENGSLESTISPPHSTLNVTPAFLTNGFSTGMQGGMDVKGRYLYRAMMQADSFEVIDLANRSSLSIVGSVIDARLDSTEPTGRSDMIVVDDHVYLFNAATDRLITINVSDVANPQVIADIATPALFNAKLFDIGNSAILLHVGTNFITYDISDPANIALINNVSHANTEFGVLFDNYYFSSLRSSGGAVYVCDVADPSNITCPYTSLAPTNSAATSYKASYWGNILTLVDDDNGDAWTFAFDTNNPANPVEINHFSGEVYFQGNQGRGPISHMNMLVYRDSLNSDPGSPNQPLKIFRITDGGKKMVQAYFEDPAPANTRFLSDGETLGRYFVFNGDGEGIGIAEITPCQNPAGVLGDIIHNSSERVFQGCTDDGWVALHQAGSGGAGCSSPSGIAGEIIFNSSENLYQGCTVDGWIAFHE